MAEDRPDMPYEKAIEEAAKTLGKALEVVQSASPTVADIYGWMIGDRVSAARQRNAESMARKTKKIIEERNIKEPKPVPESLATPLLEQAQKESREELQDAYAALLANAMDPNYDSDVRPEFVGLVNSLEPLDLKILRHITTDGGSRFRTVDLRGHFNIKYREGTIEIALANLNKFGLVNLSDAETAHPTTLGKELMIACDPHSAEAEE